MQHSYHATQSFHHSYDVAAMYSAPYSNYYCPPYIPLSPEPEVLDLSKKPSPESPYNCSSPDSSVFSNSIRSEYVQRQCSPPSYIPEAVQTDSSATEYAKSPSPASVKSEPRSETSAQSQSPKSRGARPFKVLPKDSLTLALGAITQLDPTTLINDDEVDPELTKGLIQDSVKKYAEFRERMLKQLHTSGTTTNKNMRRIQNNSDKTQDTEYMEKRRKNNEAAKRSRDARRIKQDEIAIRMAFLEQENMMLKYRIQSEKEDLERLQKMSDMRK
ncbi:uncharacterized protein LOC143204650 [Rhynchophorus ferrugineus]|uniref:uncharacterized protein LOC143204650 n=1 Tax=Rhynchophorus ferrugineus TaxID=354439 RepID=UPI003FCE4EC7